MPLEEKKSLKKAVLDRGLEGLQKTGKTMKQKYLALLEQETRVLLAKGGPHKRKRKVKVGSLVYSFKSHTHLSQTKMMHRESCMCGMESLELFQVPPTNIALQESKWMEYYPVASTLNSDTAPIEFDIQGQGDEFIDLSQTYLQVVCKFTKDDGSN